MRTQRPAIALLALALTALAGCNKPPDPSVDPPLPPPAPPATINPDDLKDITASYACEGGSRVDIVRDVVARVTLNNGKVVKLEIIERSTPPTYTDHGLTLELLSGGRAELSDEKSGTLSCTDVAGESRPT